MFVKNYFLTDFFLRLVKSGKILITNVSLEIAKKNFINQMLSVVFMHKKSWL